MTLRDDMNRMCKKDCGDEIQTYRNRQRSFQTQCLHRNHWLGGSYWAIGLIHNYRDGLPRGLCLRCHLLIEPNHWADGGPNKIVWQQAHSLYPVVRLLDKLDVDLVLLSEAHDKSIDAVMRNCGPDLKAIRQLVSDYESQKAKLTAKCEEDTRPWRKYDY